MYQIAFTVCGDGVQLPERKTKKAMMGFGS